MERDDLIAFRQDAMVSTLAELEASRQEMESLTTLQLVYRLADAAWLMGWWREWGDWKLEDRRSYIAVKAHVEDCLDLLDVRLKER